METLQPKLRFPEFEEDWGKVKLKDVSTYFNGGSFENDVKEEGKYELITLKSIDVSGNLAHSKRYLDIEIPTLSKNTLIMILSEQSPSLLGMTALIPIDNRYVLNQRVAEIRPSSKVESYFLSLAINRNQHYFSKLGAGTKVQNISKPNVENYEFLCPFIPEQTKIANFLSAVDEKLNLLKEKKEALETYKKGIMQKIFNQELRFKPDQSGVEGDDNGNEFPKWEEKTLGEIAEINKGNQLNKDELNDFDTYPSISGGIEPSGYTDKFNRLENTIIISEGGNSCGYVNYIKTKFWCGGHCYSIELLNDINKLFIYQLLKFNQEGIMSLRVGSGLPNIQKKDLKSFSIEFPSSILEQTKIANFLSAIDKKIELVSTQIQDTQEYKKGLLQQMFV